MNGVPATTPTTQGLVFLILTEQDKYLMEAMGEITELYEKCSSLIGVSIPAPDEIPISKEERRDNLCAIAERIKSNTNVIVKIGNAICTLRNNLQI